MKCTGIGNLASSAVLSLAFVGTAAATPLPNGATIENSTTGCFLAGSARILATSKKIHCTATFLEINGPCNFGADGVLASKNLPIIIKAKQAGD